MLPAGTLQSERTIDLHQHTLTLHFASHPDSRHELLLLYATGDGGWHRKDLDFFKELATTGFPVAGFDARDYVTHFDTSETTTPMGLARDYLAIIEASRDALHLPATAKVVLVGVSRGADIAVVAAAQRQVHRELAGVVAVALTKEEEYVRRLRLPRRGAPSSPPSTAPAPPPSPDGDPEGEMAAPYDSIRRFGMLPVAVIQSTSDQYLPADEARRLFGSDTALHHFEAIPSSNHSFSDARVAMYGAVREALGWIEGLARR